MALISTIRRCNAIILELLSKEDDEDSGLVFIVFDMIIGGKRKLKLLKL
tara:strand:+ start:1816 stop:1962 length:147 start_codon:yes stop_codon:yes gene_type:complete